MKGGTILKLTAAAAAAVAFMIPDDFMAQQLSLSSNPKEEQQQSVVAVEEDDHHQTPLPAVENFLKEAAGSFQHSIENTFDTGDALLVSWLREELQQQAQADFPHPPGHGPGHGHHGDASKTIYELIQASNQTTHFAKLVDKHDDIKALLQDTENNYTLFVPIDRAFERLPGHRRKHGKDGADENENEDEDEDEDEDEQTTEGKDDGDKKEKEPSDAFFRDLLAYHVVPDLHPFHHILHKHTLPTKLQPPTLSSEPDQPQRLRLSKRLPWGLHLNVFSRVVASDIEAANGVVHAVDHVLAPPPSHAVILRSFPTGFSTLSLALETTGLGAEIAAAAHVGGTLFAPSNHAFARLDPRLNAFLFSPPGKKYLHALLRYHVVANQTLYSDAFYKAEAAGAATTVDNEDVDEDVDAPHHPPKQFHVDLPTLLGGRTLGVDINHWPLGRIVTLRVNRASHVVLQDIVAADGVIQVVSKVLIPPHPRRKPTGRGMDNEAEGEGAMSAEELVERLEPFVAAPAAMSEL